MTMQAGSFVSSFVDTADESNANVEDCSLVVIIDCNPTIWASLASWRRQQQTKPSSSAAAAAAAGGGEGDEKDGSTFVRVIDELLVFLKAFQLLSSQNALAVIAATPTSSQFVFSPELILQPHKEMDVKKKRKIGEKVDIDETLAKKLHKLTKNMSTATPAAATNDQEGGGGAAAAAASSQDPSLANRVALGSCLARALCYCNRKKQAQRIVQQRILVVQVCDDTMDEYVTVMNSIFSAQKMGIVVDACVLRRDSMFLQQAADLTRGVYFKPTNLVGLSQYLICCFLPSTSCRVKMSMPKQPLVDYRVSCFCHQNVIEIAVVCSVCLAPHCKMEPFCKVCGTRQMGQIKKKK